MERLRSLTLAAAVFALAPGCIHVHTDADGKLKSVDVKAAFPPGKAADPGVVDPQVKPASATVPAAPVAAASAAGLSKFVPKFGGSQPTELNVLWQNKIARLPDPSRGGTFGTGLVGQMFLADSKTRQVPADGKLVVELYNETPKYGVVSGEPDRLGSWTLEKDVLKRLVTNDERFGKCYALFLPWPTYTPTVTRVRMVTRFEPEGGFALYAEPTTFTIDTSVGGDANPVVRSSVTVPAGSPILMPPTPPPAAGGFAPPIPMYPPTPGGPGAAAVPPGLPPIALTLPGR